MTQISSMFRLAGLTPRTADYVAALIREGDNFDFGKWLQRVREEEHQVTPVQATDTLGDARNAELGHPFDPPNSRGPCPASVRRSGGMKRVKTVRSG